MIKDILSSNAPKPIGPYSQAIKAGNFLFVSGQIPINPENGQIEPEDIEIQTKRVMENLKAILSAAQMTFENVVKTNIYLNDLTHFDKVNAIYEKYVTKPYPARATIEVKNLPKGSLIEVDLIAYKE